MLASHRVLTGPAAEADEYAEQFRVIQARRAAAQAHLLISVPAVLGAVAVFLWVAGLKIHDYAVLTACHPFSSNACQALNNNFNGTDWTMANTINIFVNLTPALIGAFAGAPVLARELETGTFRYAWTQGFGRERWTIAKLALLAVTVTAVAGAFSQVFVWFFQPFLAQEGLTVLAATVFATHGIAFAAWTLVAFAIGALAGMSSAGSSRPWPPPWAPTPGSRWRPGCSCASTIRWRWSPKPQYQPRSLQRQRSLGPEHVVHRTGRQAGQPVRAQPDLRAVPQ